MHRDVEMGFTGSDTRIPPETNIEISQACPGFVTQFQAVKAKIAARASRNLSLFVGAA